MSSHNGSESNANATETKKEDKAVDESNICRDFLNNICNRGSRCKFFHPQTHEKAQCAAEEPYNFCIDYQNQGCFRDNCRFVHAKREEVERYKKTGEVSLALARALAALVRSETIHGIPVCKQFQTDSCNRGQNCRFWHINIEEERNNRFSGRACGGGGSAPIPPSPGGFFGSGGEMRRHYGHNPYDEDDYGPPHAKRYAPAQAPMYPPAIAAPPPPRLVVELERKNAELMTEVESLRRELRREKERYEDLVSLFKATQSNSTLSAAVSGQGPRDSSGTSMGGLGGITSAGGQQIGQHTHSWATTNDPSKYNWV